MLLARMLAEWRKQREIPIRALAKTIGIEYSSLWRFEQGKEVEGRHLAKIIQWVLCKTQ